MTVLEEGRRLRFGGPSGRPFRFDFSTLVGFLSTSVTTFIWYLRKLEQMQFSTDSKKDVILLVHTHLLTKILQEKKVN